jgi:hypothetical protein
MQKNMLMHVSLFIFVVVFARSQQPATINVDRNWTIPESTKLGTIVKTVDVQGENNETIIFSLSLEDPFNPNQENPFWIHPNTVSLHFKNRKLQLNL